MKSMIKGALSALIVVLALSGLTAASALASGPPIVETKPATAIGGIEATLNGKVNKNELATKYYFEYGPTTSYGTKTAEAGVLTEEVKKVISGLSTLTTYHFRVVATNSSGTSFGADQSFTTIAEKPEFAIKAEKEHKLTSVEFNGTETAGDWDLPHHLLVTSCHGGSFRGVLTGSKTLSGKIIFTACSVGGRTCRSMGSPNSEEIVIETLTGTLVYISKAAKTVGLDLKPTSGSVLVHLQCGVAKSEVIGSIIFPITSPVNKFSRELSFGEMPLNFEGEQQLTEYETGAGTKVHSALESNFVVQSGFQPLGWGKSAGYTEKTNLEFEIQA